MLVVIIAVNGQRTILIGATLLVENKQPRAQVLLQHRMACTTGVDIPRYVLLSECEGRQREVDFVRSAGKKRDNYRLNCMNVNCYVIYLI